MLLEPRFELGAALPDHLLLGRQHLPAERSLDSDEGEHRRHERLEGGVCLRFVPARAVEERLVRLEEGELEPDQI
jgi:hypothetical protein